MEIIKNAVSNMTTDTIVAVGLVTGLLLAIGYGQERLCDTLAAGLVGFLGRSVLKKE